MTELEKYLMIGLASLATWFIKDLVGRLTRGTGDVPDLKAELRAATQTIGKLEASVTDLRDVIQKFEVALASLSSNFIGRSEYSDSNKRLHQRLDELNNLVVTGRFRRMEGEPVG